jgi:acyl-CoA reductase-like NAD-dependent aldehyde dehydrogenase
MSTNRIIVDAKVYDGFVDRFTTHVKGLKVGNPNEPDTAIGPRARTKLRGLGEEWDESGISEIT